MGFAVTGRRELDEKIENLSNQELQEAWHNGTQFEVDPDAHWMDKKNADRHDNKVGEEARQRGVNLRR